MNRQAVYDQVKAHLLTQGKRAMNEVEECLYRGPNGTKCAVGCLIEDEHYFPGLEFRRVHHPAVRAALARSGVEFKPGSRDETLLMRLQNVHDKGHVPEWAHELEDVARAFNLNP